MNSDQLFNASGLAVKAIVAKAAGQQAQVNPDHLLELATAAKTMRAALVDAIETCEVCRELDQLVSQRCTRCRAFISLTGGAA